MKIVILEIYFKLDGLIYHENENCRST